MFQFPNGAILIKNPNFQETPEGLFQFPNGAILIMKT